MGLSPNKDKISVVFLTKNFSLLEEYEYLLLLSKNSLVCVQPEYLVLKKFSLCKEVCLHIIQNNSSIHPKFILRVHTRKSIKNTNLQSTNLLFYYFLLFHLGLQS